MLQTPTGDAPPVLDDGWRAGWSRLADLGLPAFCVPEESDGFGFRVDAAVAAATALGAALHGSPYAGVAASGYALGHSADPASTELLELVLGGEVVPALGLLEAGSDVVRGVDGGVVADALVVVDAASGELLLASDGAWQSTPQRPAFDVTRTCVDVTIDPARCTRVATGIDPLPLYGLLLAADAAGAVQRSLDRTVAYSATREAFGTVIGGFQAVQHRLVDHTIRARGLGLAIDDAADALMDGSPQAGRSVAFAEIAVSSAAVRVLHDLVQLTGGIGFTWEHGLHLFERRAQQDARLLANPRRAARTLAELEGWTRVS